jgi:hypothetical protein
MRPDLSAQVNEYAERKAAARFVAPAAAPIFRSPDQNGTYPIMRRSNFKKRTDNARNEGGRYNRIVGEFGQGNFACDEHGLENPVDERRRKRYAQYFDAEKSAANMTWFQNMLNWEYRVSTLFSGGGWTNTNVATAWSTTASGVPLTDLQTGIDALQDNCGVSSFDISLIIPRADYQEMNLTAQIIDKVKYTYPGIQPTSLSAQQIANMLELKRVLVAQSVQDSTEEGVAETNAQIWTAGVMYLAVLCDVDDDLEEPSAARTVLWTGDSPEIPVIESYREEAIRSDVIRVRDDTDEVLIGATDLFVYKLTNT